ncbi:MAG TPA: 4'-phosphopantetheinyl transferase superfamily protein [Candidatus Pullilachnospira intestinigallinarum]|nr:4'-phosphopantetheinyl transferase superfamily protein [Candidatus Pullilachnospira intestinigallinarum]
MKDVIEIRWAALETWKEGAGRDEPVSERTGVPEAAGKKSPSLSARVRQGRRLSLLGRELLAEILLEKYGIDLPREPAPIARHPLGKPYLSGHEGLYFSISHSACWAACAVGRIPLGLDIQYRKKKKTELLAARILSAQEYAIYETAGDREFCFYDFWVKKESYLKYTGEGIRRDLRTVTGEDGRFFFLPQMIPDCAAALCVPAGWDGVLQITEKASGNV